MVGVFLGWLLGILFAPKSGKQTRKYVTATASTAKDKTAKEINRICSELDTYLTTLRNKLLGGSIKRVENHLSSIENKVKEARNGSEVDVAELEEILRKTKDSLESLDRNR